VGEDALLPSGTSESNGDALLPELTRRGITESVARRLLEEMATEQAVLDQLEWGDFLIDANPGRIRNPAGFYVTLLRENVSVPGHFETTRRREKTDEARRQVAREEAERDAALNAYADHVAAHAEAYLQTPEGRREYESLVSAKRTETLRKFPVAASWKPQHLSDHVDAQARRELERRVAPVSFEEFARSRRDASTGQGPRA
jgi:hypothetical protein